MQHWHRARGTVSTIAKLSDWPPNFDTSSPAFLGSTRDKWSEEGSTIAPLHYMMNWLIVKPLGIKVNK
jgi:hypothetical protein